MISIDIANLRDTVGRFIITHDFFEKEKNTAKSKWVILNQIVRVNKVDDSIHKFWGQVISGPNAGKYLESQYDHRTDESICVYDEWEIELAKKHLEAADSTGSENASREVEFSINV